MAKVAKITRELTKVVEEVTKVTKELKEFLKEKKVWPAFNEPHPHYEIRCRAHRGYNQ